MVRIAMFTVIMLAMNAIYAASAQPLPQPKAARRPATARRTRCPSAVHLLRLLP
jgi:hypothetical protein